jgi:2-iminobutanoate/2-iminopropanoate deaminase
MKKETIFPPGASATKGPYSPAVAVGDLVFVSGQIPADPDTGRLVDGGIEDKAARVFENVRMILEAAGSGLDKVVRVTLFVADMDDFAAVNEVYARYFGPEYPARACVEVARLPLDVALEACAIAHR